MIIYRNVFNDMLLVAFYHQGKLQIVARQNPQGEWASTSTELNRHRVHSLSALRALLREHSDVHFEFDSGAP